jgi:transposase
VARPAGALWRREEHPPAVQPLEQNWVWQRVFEHLAAEADNEYAMIDSTIVRAHQHSAGAPKKR